MMSCIEQEVLKDLPGYKAILKSVLKSQIQNLVEQLSQETEEETVLLSVSTSDGTLSHLGSLHGKDFLQDKDEIKFQFLTHCLKKKHSATTANKPLDNIVPTETHTSSQEDTNSRDNGTILAGQVPQSKQNLNELWESSPKQTLNQLWQHSIGADNIPPQTRKDNDIVNTIDETFQKNQDDFPDANTEFSETFTVNGEKLVIQTNTSRRKRKRKPNHIPNTQRIKVSETDANVKSEDVEQDGDTVEPSPLKVPNPLSSQADNSFVTVKAEPVNDTLEDVATASQDIAAMSNNQSLIEGMSDGGFQHDIPLMRGLQQECPLLTPDNMPMTPSDKTPKQESAEGKFYLNFGSDVGKVPLNPAEMYKTRYRKMLNIKLEEGDRPFKCPLCARGFKLRHHLQNHYSVHSGERLYDCDICGKSFMRRGTMQIHRRIHNRDTPYQCTKCLESFMRKDRLLYHKCPGSVAALQDNGQNLPQDYSQSSSSDQSLDYSKSVIDMPLDFPTDYSKLSSDVQKIIAGYTDGSSDVLDIPTDLSKALSPVTETPTEKALSPVTETPTDYSKAVSEEPTYVL